MDNVIEGHYTEEPTAEVVPHSSSEMTTSLPINDMARMAEAASIAYKQSGFGENLKERSANTKRRKRNELANFCRYLERGGVFRTPNELMTTPERWQHINRAIVAGFKQWLIEQGYYYTTINYHLQTIRHFCKMAGPEISGGAGVLDADTILAIGTVQDITPATIENVDQDRRARGISTRKGKKKVDPTPITIEQSKLLKKAVIPVEGNRTRPHDLLLEDRDRLMSCLMLEHALRCSEVCDLNIENINLVAGTMIFYRKKTRKTETHKLKRHTLAAAGSYLDKVKRIEKRMDGPLFTGYQGKRISTSAINTRVGQLGQTIELDTLSPHDLRHEWTVDAFRNGTSIDRVQAGGGWSSEIMPLKYAKRVGVANEGVKLTSDEGE